MKISGNRLQIGVMGSAADLNYSTELQTLAEEVGASIAQAGGIVLFGAEKDYDSLSTAAARGAKRAGGLTVGITYGKDREIYESNTADVVIATGLERGGGRELALVASCDAIITIGGGSGTLTEIAIAYQANIPIVALEGTGGWSEKLAGQYLDDRKRIKIEVAQDPKSSVTLAISLARKRSERNIDLSSYK